MQGSTLQRPKGYTGRSEMPQLFEHFACMQKKAHPLTQGWCRSGQIHERLWRFTAKTAYTIISQQTIEKSYRPFDKLYVELFGFDSLLYCIYSIYSGRRAVYLPEQDRRPGQGMRHALSKNNVNALLSTKRLRHLKHFWTCKLAMCRVIIISRTQLY